MPKVSAIMPIYNGIRFIKESIESIQNQTFTDWEFIIVNELGSDDGCREIISFYANSDERIKLIQNETRLGLAQSLNIGISQATGKYIARVDVDDPSFPERFETQVNYMENHPDVFLCGTFQNSVLPSKTYKQVVATDYEPLKASMLFGCEISHCSVMFRRNIWFQEQLQYDPDSLCEDYDLWMKLIFRKKFINIGEALVNHRWGFGNISLLKGKNLRDAACAVSARTLKEFQIDIINEGINPIVLSGWRNKPIEFAQKHRLYFLTATYKLLQQLSQKNDQLQLIEKEALDDVIKKRWQWTFESCDLPVPTLKKYIFKDNPGHDLISIIYAPLGDLPQFINSVNSIILQTHINWELIFVESQNTLPEIKIIFQIFRLYDYRIRIIADSQLTSSQQQIDFEHAQVTGNYVIIKSENSVWSEDKLALQCAFLENRQFDAVGNSVEIDGIAYIVDNKPEQIKANLLIKNENHLSTILFRRSSLLKASDIKDILHMSEHAFLLQYVVHSTMGNVEMILDHFSKHEQRNASLNQIYVAIIGNLENNLRFTQSLQNKEQIANIIDGKAVDLACIRSWILQIIEANKLTSYYDKQALMNVLGGLWSELSHYSSWKDIRPVYSINRIFDPQCKLTTKERIERIAHEYCGISGKMRLFFKAIRRISGGVGIDDQKDLENALKRHIDDITWERYMRLDEKIQKLQSEIYQLKSMSESQLQSINTALLKPGEKIRIVFLFQVPSFWPSWDSLWEACQRDPEIDAKLIWLNETNTEKAQMLSAHDFLEEKQLPYTIFDEFNLSSFSPHIVIYQTPYDNWHRQHHTWTGVIKRKGVRIVYVPYGIEISDTESARDAHFKQPVILNSWRIYTFSQKMLADYQRYCLNKDAVRVTGLPKFDSYLAKDDYPLSQNIIMKARGRKIYLWKVHFPKLIYENGAVIQCTIDLSVYKEFAQYIRSRNDIFFVFMPHPRFTELNGSPNNQLTAINILDMLYNTENVYIDMSDDYRNSLMHVDGIIIDRSATMVEAGAVNVPILLMTNKTFYEPFTEAILPLMNSYYQGNSCKDMIDFIKMCDQDLDPLKIVRQNAFAKCIPYFDGHCGERIKNDLKQGLYEESDIRRKLP